MLCIKHLYKLRQIHFEYEWKGYKRIAYHNGWISEEKMRELAKPMLKDQYGQYLLKVIDEMKEQVNSSTLTHI